MTATPDRDDPPAPDDLELLAEAARVIAAADAGDRDDPEGYLWRIRARHWRDLYDVLLCVAGQPAGELRLPVIDPDDPGHDALLDELMRAMKTPLATGGDVPLVMRVARDPVRPALPLIDLAWGLIANAGGGDWMTQTAEWREAAGRWREGYHLVLAEVYRQHPQDGD